MPQWVVCLVSALRFHDIGTQVPAEVWRAVWRGTRVPRSWEGQVFERFNEDARRCLFFARYKTTERNGETVTDDDLLHGISLGGPAAIELLGGIARDALKSAESGEQFWTRMQNDPDASVRSQKEIRFSRAGEDVLQFATAEADLLRHKNIGPEHLLLGLLHDETTDAGRRLHAAGVRLSDFRLRVRAHHEGGPAA